MRGRATRHNRAGWKRLWVHSYRLGLAWLARTARHGLQPGRRAGLQRLLVPLDPWRYYELGAFADEEFAGRCLDVSSPKLLTSLLERESNGSWLGLDLFEDEIDAWRAIDPKLELEVQDATELPYDSETFDNAICVSVIEHMGRGNDNAALAEIFRVVKPGGRLQLSTMVSSHPGDVHVDHRIYGNASQEAGDGKIFFEHVYSLAEFEAMTSEAGWVTEHVEYAVQTRPRIQQRFYRLAPFSYLLGPVLFLWFPRTIEVGEDRDRVQALPHEQSAIVNARLVKPA